VGGEWRGTEALRVETADGLKGFSDLVEVSSGRKSIGNGVRV